MTIKNQELEDEEINHTAENLELVGQMTVGGVEIIGGILTGDPTTRAEGKFNAKVGSLYQETNKNLAAIDEAKHDELKQTNQTETNH